VPDIITERVEDLSLARKEFAKSVEHYCFDVAGCTFQGQSAHACCGIELLRD
jgi:hypothetical protein